MIDSLCPRIADALHLTPRQVRAVLELLEQGATIPFITRYRKEATGSLDEVAITAVRDKAEALRELEKRREAIRASLAERDLLTPELEKAVAGAETLGALEDAYLPFRPKRSTRAAKARERGLEPLARMLAEQQNRDASRLARNFCAPGTAIENEERALAGARDILAEEFSEDARARSFIRDLFRRKATARCRVAKGKETDNAALVYRDYFNRDERAFPMPAHRVLAMFRGEREGALSVRVRPEDEEALEILERCFLKKRNRGREPDDSDIGQVRLALKDAWTRLMAPSMENEFRGTLTERAEKEAIAVFSANLRAMLLAPPLGPKNVLALDPGRRTGAKLVCLNAQGALVHHDVVFPLDKGKKAEHAAATIRALCAEHHIEAVAVGNGTAGRETEAFVRELNLPASIEICLVDERGASVYSTSAIGRREFPEHDATVRGAASIGRRLMDPLAELVKIDPRSIGVGQYQHDVDQAALRRSLEEVVASCVNAVGVDVNTASPELLSHVSGIGPGLAQAVTEWREKNGPFRGRADLLKVPRFGPKTFELAAGFLRINHGENPLDASAVHPESYGIVRNMAKDLDSSITDLMSRPELRRRIRAERYTTERAGLPTILDILDELNKPGRDPRPAFEHFRFADNVRAVEDLKPGMKLPGIVTNVAKFGAFVDIGVHRDGMVHISRMADRYVSDPGEILAPGQRVLVTVLEVDHARGRIALSLRDEAPRKDERAMDG